MIEESLTQFYFIWRAFLIAKLDIQYLDTILLYMNPYYCTVKRSLEE